mmetsp:Transcript_127180/g.231565  ORF Transcript_127180/g.231565 Transcript_127180/m.231565 type:complete len:257 (-) Transcript_127180:958-1728(-)
MASCTLPKRKRATRSSSTGCLLHTVAPHQGGLPHLRGSQALARLLRRCYLEATLALLPPSIARRSLRHTGQIEALRSHGSTHSTWQMCWGAQGSCTQGGPCGSRAAKQIGHSTDAASELLPPSVTSPACASAALSLGGDPCSGRKYGGKDEPRAPRMLPVALSIVLWRPLAITAPDGFHLWCVCSMRSCSFERPGTAFFLPFSMIVTVVKRSPRKDGHADGSWESNHCLAASTARRPLPMPMVVLSASRGARQPSA